MHFWEELDPIDFKERFWTNSTWGLGLALLSLRLTTYISPVSNTQALAALQHPSSISTPSRMTDVSTGCSPSTWMTRTLMTWTWHHCGFPAAFYYINNNILLRYKQTINVLNDLKLLFHYVLCIIHLDKPSRRHKARLMGVRIIFIWTSIIWPVVLQMHKKKSQGCWDGLPLPLDGTRLLASLTNAKPVEWRLYAHQLPSLNELGPVQKNKVFHSSLQNRRNFRCKVQITNYGFLHTFASYNAYFLHHPTYSRLWLWSSCFCNIFTFAHRCYFFLHNLLEPLLLHCGILTKLLYGAVKN